MSAPQLHSNWPGVLRALQPGWDSYDGKPITEQAIGTIMSFSVVPCSSGGIQLEIHQDGFDIEICVDPTGKIESALVCCEPKI